MENTTEVEEIDADTLQIPYVGWEIMTQCNMGCQFCYSSSWNKWLWQGQHQLKNPSVDAIIYGLHLLKDSNLGVQYMNWSGGELLLRHNDMPEILKRSSKMGFKNIISTNCMFTPIFGTKEKFEKFLEKIGEYLDFMAVSWDAADRETNNDVMRLNASGKHGSEHHYDDVQAFLEMYKGEKFSFYLKVNTLVTKKNFNHIGGILQTLKDIPCVWHLIQFNPRECPPEFRTDYWIEKSQYFELVQNIVRENASFKQSSKCFVTTRLYNGDNEPYCFPVLNTSGDVLLPKGEQHIVLVNIFNKQWEPHSFKRELAKRITEEISNTKTHIEKAGSGINSKTTSQVFSEVNNDILQRYLHPTFRQQEAIRKINKLANVTRALLASVPDWHSAELCDSINKTEKIADEEKLNYFLWLNKNIREPNYKEIPNYNRMKFVLEQRKVSILLRDKWGIIGGTMVVLNRNESPLYRVVPCIDRVPYGIHFPWLFRSSYEQQNFFRKFFKGGVRDVNFKNFSDTINGLLIERVLPRKVLSDVLVKSVREGSRDRFHVLVDQYLSGQILTNEDDINKATKQRIISFILTNCIETISSILVRSNLDERIEKTETKIENDPLYRLFYNDHIRKESLSPIERKLNFLFVPAEEAIFSIANWFNQISSDKIDRRWVQENKKIWEQLCENERMTSWKQYQKEKGGVLKLPEAVFENMFKRNASNIKRVLPIFWLYYFAQNIDDKYVFHVPHVVYIPFVGRQTQTIGIQSFFEFHFDDTIFKNFWPDMEKIWVNDINEMDVKRYMHNIESFVSPVAYYNAHLELQRETEKAVKDAEWKNLFRKLWHNTQFHVAGAMDLASKLETRLRELAPSEHFPKLTEYLHDLRYVLELSRYVDNPQDYVIARDTAQRIRWPKETNIGKIVQEIVIFIKTDTQKDEGRVLRIETDDLYKALCQGVQDDTLFELCIDDTVCVTSYPEVVAMIIKDIVVNATSNAIDLNALQKGCSPKVTIKVAKEPNGKGAVFTVRNESGISNEAFSIWKEGKIPDASKLHNPLGILICGNYLNWLGYRFDIPEACIKEKGGSFTEVSIHFLDEPLEFIKWKERENVSQNTHLIS